MKAIVWSSSRIMFEKFLENSSSENFGNSLSTFGKHLVLVSLTGHPSISLDLSIPTLRRLLYFA